LDKSEKRRAPRVKAEKGTEGRLKLTVPVSINDVSAGGVRFELATALRPGSLYDLKANLKGSLLTTQVRITRCSTGGFVTDASGARVLQYNAGAEFAQLAPEQKQLLDKWLEAVGNRRRSPSSGTLSRLSPEE
jgi:hypothetical protein